MSWSQRFALVLVLAAGGYLAAWLLGHSTLVEPDLPGAGYEPP